MHTIIPTSTPGTVCEHCQVIDDSVQLRATNLFLRADCTVWPACRDCGQGMLIHTEGDRCHPCHSWHHYGLLPGQETA